MTPNACRHSLHLESGNEVVLGAYGSPGDPLVVAIPGWKGTDTGIEAILRDTVKSKFRVEVFNYPGGGVSPECALPDDPDRLLEFLSNLISETVNAICPNEKIILLGHSFGAQIAAAAARKLPGRALGLIIVSPLINRPTPEKIADRLANYCSRIYARMLARPALGPILSRSRIPGTLSNIFLARSKTFGAYKIIRESRRERQYVGSHTALAKYFNLAQHPNWRLLAKPITVNATIIAGDQDMLSNVQSLRALTETFALGKLHLIRKLGHLANYEDPEAMSAVVASEIRAILPTDNPPRR